MTWVSENLHRHIGIVFFFMSTFNIMVWHFLLPQFEMWSRYSNSFFLYKKSTKGYLDFLGWRLVRLAFNQRQLAQAPPTLSAEGAVIENGWWIRPTECLWKRQRIFFKISFISWGNLEVCIYCYWIKQNMLILMYGKSFIGNRDSCKNRVIILIIS